MHGGMARGEVSTAMDLRPVVSGMASTQPAFPCHRLGVRDAGVPQSGHMACLRILPGVQVGGMTIRSLVRQQHWGRLVALIRLRGGTKHARRLLSIDLVPAHGAEMRSPQKAWPRPHGRAPTPTASTSPDAPVATPAAVSDDPPARPAATGGPALSLAGKSETELRAMLGAPTSEEDRPPVNGGAIETGNAPWTSSSIRTSRQNSSELLRTR